jgi:endoglucanase
MFKKAAIFAFVFACLCGAANFTATHGKLKVSGSKILDKNNNEVVLRGMSLFWHQWTDGSKFYTQSNVNSLANNWKTSLVRAALQTSDIAMARNMMDWTNAAGIYVIIDNHSHDAHNNTQAVANFFKDVSAYVKQKSYTHVLYELYNEPINTQWADIKRFAEPVIDAIRVNDPDGLIIVGTPNYSANISAARSNPLTGTRAKNVLYALHFYAGEAGHSTYRIALEAAYCAGFPVFVSEWGTSPASGNGAISTSNSNTWISLLEAAKVSWANWSITDKNESSAALSSNNIDGGLTLSGTYVKNLFGLNDGKTLSQVGLTQPTINCSSEPEPPSGPDGKIRIGANHLLSNFLSKNGADNINTAYGDVLINTSANFTANYNIVNIDHPGSYLIRFYTANTAGGTVSWSGSGISSGAMQIASTGSLDTYKATDMQVIKINESPQTPLNLSFQAPSANSLKAVFVSIFLPSSEDSVKYNITPILPKNIISGNYWNYDSFTSSFVFEKNEGILEIYNLRGEKVQTFAAQGRVLVNMLPSGTYIAVYRLGGNTSRKIFLKRGTT